MSDGQEHTTIDTQETVPVPEEKCASAPAETGEGDAAACPDSSPTESDNPPSTCDNAAATEVGAVEAEKEEGQALPVAEEKAIEPQEESPSNEDVTEAPAAESGKTESEERIISQLAEAVAELKLKGSPTGSSNEGQEAATNTDESLLKTRRKCVIS